MSYKFIIICCLTVILHFFGIIMISSRIVAIRTKKVASSASVFNLISIFSLAAATIQFPILTKLIESSIETKGDSTIVLVREILVLSTLGTLLGAFAIPSVQRIMKRLAESLFVNGSLLKVLFNRSTFKEIKQDIVFPKKATFYFFKLHSDIPMGIILINIFAYCMISSSVLFCLYAGFLNPALRTTSLALKGLSIGLGSFATMMIIEPYNSSLTDQVIHGINRESYFRRYISYVVFARISGTILAQFLLVPMAKGISFISLYF